MADLKCNARRCNYNCSGLCSRESIMVTGGGSKENTCCESFTDAPSSVSSLARNLGASKKTEIYCKARDCEYNKGEKCSASSITVQSIHPSRGGVSTSLDTECSTFRKINRN